ncbi:hypothetical protein BDF19DRAFT_421611 [Syncephalis fuscata]|nr:hypothetical protein BDF19DRAFT_421611 [Syncephalis fuscata]
MATPTAAATQLKGLYKAHLNAANKFAAYNFRQYFTRWTQTKFNEFERQQDIITDAKKKEAAKIEFTTFMERELEARQRQALINSMFQPASRRLRFKSITFCTEKVEDNKEI